MTQSSRRTRTRLSDERRSTSSRSNAKRPNSSRSQRSRTTSGGSRSNRTPVSGKRGSVRAAAERQVRIRGAVNSRNLKRIRTPRGNISRFVLVAIIFIVLAVACAAALFSQSDNAKYAACEQFRPVVEQACKDCELDISWTDCILAAMFVESGGDKGVKSVLNVDGDVMQAAEGAYGWVVKEGWTEHNVKAETTDASIYAGVMEFKQNLQLWEGYLGTITPDDTTEIQLVIQGYNFGAEGWFAWCKEKHVRAYTVELAQEYSNDKMPADAKGTPSHAQKWLAAYDVIRSN